MNKTRTTPIGEFTAQIEPVLGKKIEAYLGIPYAKAAPFALPESVHSYSEKPALSPAGKLSQSLNRSASMTERAMRIGRSRRRTRSGTFMTATSLSACGKTSCAGGMRALLHES